MRRSCFIAVILTLIVPLSYAGNFIFREGDLVFQTFPSPQSMAIQLATKSQYSHMGILLNHNGKLMVYEAVGPVKFTPIDDWIKRDRDRHMVVRRLKNADSLLTRVNVKKLETVASTFEGKPYDFVFNWSDEKIYCSELVWKVFDRALKIDIGKLRKLKDFDLSSPEVQTKLKERYPDALPLEETVVSPQDVFQSPLLMTVHQQ